MPLRDDPTLHVTIGLPGVGKTTLARQLAADESALRLTPDEWILPLFAGENPERGRDTLEGRFVWTAHRCLRLGISVVLDLGCWSAEERWALRAVAEHAGAGFALHPLDLDEEERIARVSRRWQEESHLTWAMNDDDHALYRSLYTPVGEDEGPDRPPPPPPTGHRSWLSWASQRWPSLPVLDEDPGAAL